MYCDRLAKGSPSFVEPEGRSRKDKVRKEEKTYNAHGPKHGIIDEQPRLLAEARELLRFADPHGLSNRGQDVFHDGSAEAGEEYDEEWDHVGVVDALAVFTRGGIVVGESEELDGVRLGFRNKVVGEEEESEQIERDA